MLRQATLFTLTLTAMSAARADGLAPVGPASADVRLCYASGSSGPQVPCVLQDQTWMQLQRPTDPADRMTIAPSATAPAGTLANAIAPSYGLGLSTAYMPPPSGSAATDAANFAAAQATGAKTIVLQAGGYLMPATGWSALQSNQAVAGQGSDLTTITATAQTGILGMLNAVSVSNISLSGLTLDYAGMPAPSSNNGILVLHDAKKIRITDVNLVGWPIFGLGSNGGSDVTYRRGLLIRASQPLDTSGASLPMGRQTQCINVSSSFAIATGYLFEDVSCDGAGFDTWGTGFKYVRTFVKNWSFGGAYTMERYDGNDDHQLLNVTAVGGRTRSTAGTKPNGSAVAAGYDDNDTSMLCVESWASRTVVDGLTCDDTGGDGIGLGGNNSRVVNSRMSRLGVQVPSDGIKTRVGPDGPSSKYTASGSLIANNTVANSNGSGDGSSLQNAYSQENNSPLIVVSISGNDFGNMTSLQKGQGEKWSSPGLLVSGRMTTSGSYSPCSTQKPVGSTIAGAKYQIDTIAGATFVADSGGSLSPGVRVTAEVNAENSVVWTVQDTACGSSNFTVPAGTFFARLITIN